MATASDASPLHCYDIKSADLPLVALLLKTTDLNAVSQALAQQLAESPGFFDNDPLLIDVTGLKEDLQTSTLDLSRLLDILRQQGLLPLAIKGAHSALLATAQTLGLVDASDARIRRFVPVAEPSSPAPQVLAPVAPAPLGALVIDKPLRSGQQVYAKGRDLVVLAVVNPGAEVIADGSIHVYSSLRGKAIAGARGNTQAMIFAHAMEPELISIAGVYRTSENPLPAEVAGLPAQVCLQSGPDGDKLLISPLIS
ncbi:MAG: septum site-determining protein MinC [Limnohabitans sp.]